PALSGKVWQAGGRMAASEPAATILGIQHYRAIFLPNDAAHEHGTLMAGGPAAGENAFRWPGGESGNHRALYGDLQESIPGARSRNFPRGRRRQLPGCL